jgi:tRNA(Leu) C34 or U34 (ribose-2'-O)-methylase TrmL
VSVELAGFWDIGYSAPLTEADQWRFMASDFDVDAWHMIPVSGIARDGLHEWATIEAFLAVERTATIVYVDEHGESDLEDFVHPLDAVYVFGMANFAPMGGHRTEQDLSVRITTPRAAGLLWPHQAAAIILYDRYRKG